MAVGEQLTTRIFSKGYSDDPANKPYRDVTFYPEFYTVVPHIVERTLPFESSKTPLGGLLRLAVCEADDHL